MITRTKVIVLALSFLFCVVGCSSNESASSSKEIEVACTEFFTNTQKIQANLFYPDKNISSVFEGYIDSNGNGTGLLEVGNVVREVAISNNKLITKVIDKVYAVSDIGPFFSFTSLNSDSLQVENIHLTSGKISSLSGVYNGITYTTKYEEIEKSFEQEKITIDEEISLKDFLVILSTVNSEKSDKSDAIGTMLNQEEVEEEIKEEKEPSFYINSDLGITIDGKTYSIGDKVNPDDYYKDRVPEGFSYDYVWDSVNKIETKTTSYLDTTGKLSVVTIDDVVFEISTTADFTFLGIQKGISQQELRTLLGIGLNKKEEASFSPIYPGLEVIKSESKTITCSVGSLTIEFGFKDKKLNSIYLTEDRGYLHYDS